MIAWCLFVYVCVSLLDLTATDTQPVIFHQNDMIPLELKMYFCIKFGDLDSNVRNQGSRDRGIQTFSPRYGKHKILHFPQCTQYQQMYAPPRL